MKKTLTLILALGMVCFLAFGAAAAEKKIVKKHAETFQVAGTVVSVNAAAKTLVIKEKTGDITVTVNNRTIIESGNRQKKFADINAGAEVIVKYAVVDAVKIAKIIIIEAAKTAVPAK